MILSTCKCICILWSLNCSFTSADVELSDDVFTPNIVVPDDPIAGDSFNIFCKLDGVADRLVGGIITLVFEEPVPGGMPVNQFQNGSTFVRPHSFNPAMTSDVGMYSCLVTVRNIPSVGGRFFGDASEQLQIRSE